MIWELNKPGKGEVWTDKLKPSWTTIRSQSLVTNQQGGSLVGQRLSRANQMLEAYRVIYPIRCIAM